MRGVLTRRRKLAVVATLVVVFATFEVGVRLLPPDAVQVSAREYYADRPVRDGVFGGTFTDPVTVARWRAAMTAKPDGLLINSYVAQWQGATCRGRYVVATYTFTWHGLPVEVISTEPSCAGSYQVSSGGIPDWYTYSLSGIS